MVPINDDDVLHHIRVKLYPNYLPGGEGAFIARTDNEASLTIEQVCTALKHRGGFTGNYNDLVDHVRQYLDEVAYQLCDGFAVNTGYYSVHPNVGGTFDKVTEGHDSEKHPITFRFRTRAPLRAIASHIVVEVEGLANVQGYIDEFLDVTTESINETLTPKGQFSISGHKIKVAGDDAAVGIFFVMASDPTQYARVDVHLAENIATKVIGVAPDLPAGTWKVQIVTQYTHGSSQLKEPRVITFAEELTVAP
jgi:hypothetical protein